MRGRDSYICNSMTTMRLMITWKGERCKEEVRDFWSNNNFPFGMRDVKSFSGTVFSSIWSSFLLTLIIFRQDDFHDFESHDCGSFLHFCFPLSCSLFIIFSPGNLHISFYPFRIWEVFAHTKAAGTSHQSERGKVGRTVPQVQIFSVINNRGNHYYFFVSLHIHITDLMSGEMIIMRWRGVNRTMERSLDSRKIFVTFVSALRFRRKRKMTRQKEEAENDKSFNCEFTEWRWRGGGWRWEDWSNRERMCGSSERELRCNKRGA